MQHDAAALRKRSKHFNFQENCCDGASYRVRTPKFLCTLIRDADVPHFTKISNNKNIRFKTLNIDARMIRAVKQDKQTSIQD